jgi:hypothetical protein
MFRRMLMVAVAAICLASWGIAAAETPVYDESNFSADGRKWQPAPQGHVPGKDNGPGQGLHHAGEDCGICHKKGGRAGWLTFTIGGTIYADRAARLPLKGAEVILQDYHGNVLSMTTNEVGNFWTLAPLASHPYAVGSNHGMPPFTPLYTLDADGNLLTPAPPDDARTWKYKTWIRKGDSVRPMVSIASVGGSPEVQRMACNMHHSALHRQGGMWTKNFPTLSEYPTENLSYQRHIFPILRSKCVPCHIPGKTLTSVGQKSDLGNPSTQVDYGASLDLVDYDGSNVSGSAKRGISEVVDTASPAQSLLLQKTLAGGTHAGGTFWTQSSADYRALLKWIAEGAQNN